MHVNEKGKKLLTGKRKNGRLLITAAILVCMLTACGSGAKGSAKEPSSPQNQTAAQQGGSQQGGSQKSESAISEDSIVNFHNEKGFIRLQEDMKNGDIPLECNVLYDEGGARPDVTVTDQETIREIYGQLADITVGEKTNLSVTDSYHHISFRLRNDTYVSFYYEGDDLFCWGEDNYTVSGSKNLWNTVRQLQDIAMRETPDQTAAQSQQSGTSKTGDTTVGNSSDKDSTKEHRVEGDISEDTKESMDVAVSGSGGIAGIGNTAQEGLKTSGTGTGIYGENDGHDTADGTETAGGTSGLPEDTGTDIASETFPDQETGQPSGIRGEKGTETDSSAGTSVETGTQTETEPADQTETTDIAGTADTKGTANTGTTSGQEGVAGTADTTAAAGTADTAAQGSTQETANPALDPAMEAAYTEVVRAYAKVLKVDKETFMELFSQGYYSPPTPAAEAVTGVETAPDVESASDTESVPDAEALSAAEALPEAVSEPGVEAASDAEPASGAEAAPDDRQVPDYDERINYEMFRDMYTNAVPGQVFYGLHDYNADGIQELVIAVGNEEYKTVSAMYTFDGQKAVSLFTGNFTPAYRVAVFLGPDNTFIVHGSGGAMSGGDTICCIADDRSGLKIIAEYEYDSVTYGNMDRHSKTGEVIKEEEYNAKYGQYGMMDTPDKGVSFTPVSEEAQVTLPGAAQESGLNQ